MKKPAEDIEELRKVVKTLKDQVVDDELLDDVDGMREVVAILDRILFDYFSGKHSSIIDFIDTNMIGVKSDKEYVRMNVISHLFSLKNRFHESDMVYIDGGLIITIDEIMLAVRNGIAICAGDPIRELDFYKNPKNFVS